MALTIKIDQGETSIFLMSNRVAVKAVVIRVIEWLQVLRFKEEMPTCDSQRVARNKIRIMTLLVERASRKKSYSKVKQVYQKLHNGARELALETRNDSLLIVHRLKI